MTMHAPSCSAFSLSANLFQWREPATGSPPVTWSILGRIWMNANAERWDWQDRGVIARMAAEFAPDVLATFNLTSEKMLAPLFADG
jgi:hypothetical protein